MGTVVQGPWARRAVGDQLEPLVAELEAGVGMVEQNLERSLAIPPYDPRPDVERYLGPEVRPSGLIVGGNLLDALETAGLVGHHVTIDG